MPARIRELERLAIRSRQRIRQGVEGQVAGEGHGGDNVGRRDEGVCRGVRIVTASEVAVVRGDN